MTDNRPLITIVTGSFNEEGNVRPLYARLKEIFATLTRYDFEIIWIDNKSEDRTYEILKEIAKEDPKFRVILNARNFGHIRSGFYALLQAYGDAAIIMASDFQEPPDLIPSFLTKWEEGNKVVLAQKNRSKESLLMFIIRKIYYKIIGSLSEIKLVENATGFGLYDQRVLESLRNIDDPYPYLRGLVCDLGYQRALVPFVQPNRERGVTKNRFYQLYDLAMLGITSHSKVPLRLATMFGFVGSAVSMFVALGYLAAKLIFWNSFKIGMAPAVVGLFMFASVQLFFTGILGEYIGAIHTQVRKRPYVIEQERINFGRDQKDPRDG